MSWKSARISLILLFPPDTQVAVMCASEWEALFWISRGFFFTGPPSFRLVRHTRHISKRKRFDERKPISANNSNYFDSMNSVRLPGSKEEKLRASPEIRLFKIVNYTHGVVRKKINSVYACTVNSTRDFRLTLLKSFA